MADQCGVAIPGNVGFVGAGNMAWAIGESLVKSGAISPKHIFVSAPSDTNLRRWIALGANASFENGDVIKNSDIVFIAVKPLKLEEALNDASKTLTSTVGKFFVSLLAGVKVDALHKKVNAVVPKSRVVRVMPNTPVTVGAGASSVLVSGAVKLHY